MLVNKDEGIVKDAKEYLRQIDPQKYEELENLAKSETKLESSESEKYKYAEKNLLELEELFFKPETTDNKKKEIIEIMLDKTAAGAGKKFFQAGRRNE